MAGKTGTGQVAFKPRSSDWRDHWDDAWFVGYATADAPEVLVVVLLENAGAGGKHAAPVAGDLIRAWRASA